MLVCVDSLEKDTEEAISTDSGRGRFVFRLALIKDILLECWCQALRLLLLCESMSSLSLIALPPSPVNLRDRFSCTQTFSRNFSIQSRTQFGSLHFTMASTALRRGNPPRSRASGTCNQCKAHQNYARAASTQLVELNSCLCFGASAQCSSCW